MAAASTTTAPTVTAAPAVAALSTPESAAAPAAATAAALAIVATPTEWPCEKCTYSNKGKDAKCTVCNEGVRPANMTPAPAPAATATASASSNGAATASVSSGAAAAAAAATAATATAPSKEDDDTDVSPTKKKSSYYFFSSTPKDQAAAYVPKPIDPATAAAPPPVNRVGSAWNTAGTWEDHDVSKYAKERLRAIFESGIDVPAGDFPNGALRFVSCTKCDGEASIVMARGKKKLGFELHIAIGFKGTYKGAEVEGSIDIPDFEDSNVDSADYQWNVSCAAAPDVRAFVRGAKCKALIRKTFDGFIADLKNH